MHAIKMPGEYLHAIGSLPNASSRSISAIITIREGHHMAGAIKWAYFLPIKTDARATHGRPPKLGKPA